MDKIIENIFIILTLVTMIFIAGLYGYSIIYNDFIDCIISGKTQAYCLYFK